MEEGKAVINEILDRSSYLKRPKVSNISQVIFVVAPRMPALNSLVLDKELCFAEHIRINPVIVINEKKTNEIFEIYTKAGFKVIKMQAEKGEGISHLKEVLKSNTSVLAGESGVR